MWPAVISDYRVMLLFKTDYLTITLLRMLLVCSYFLDELILNNASFEREDKSYFPSWIELLRYSEIIFEKMWKDVEGHWYMLGAREDVCPIF